MTNVLSILDRLVAFDTTSSNPNLEMVEYIEDVCKSRGGTCWRIESATPGKAGLVARFGPDEPGGIVWSAHCDVVPITGQAWTRPAFKLTQDGDRLFGRGTTDMKGFLACMLDAAGKTAAHNLHKPLTLVFSYDEEIGCVGIQEMKAELPPLLNAPRLCIVGEPTTMQIATGHKGKAALNAVFKGQSGHSALAPHFLNALHLATDFIHEMRRLQDWYAEQGSKDAAYDVPYSTLHVGKLYGGTALNIVPDKADMTFEYRYLPADGDDAMFEKIQEIASEILARYKEQFACAAIEIERTNAYPGLEIGQGTDAAQFAQSLAGGTDFTKVAFGTEAGVFTELGIPTIVCGPGSMSGQGHKPDEFIELAQLNACSDMLANAVDALR